MRARPSWRPHAPVCPALPAGAATGMRLPVRPRTQPSRIRSRAAAGSRTGDGRSGRTRPLARLRPVARAVGRLRRPAHLSVPPPATAGWLRGVGGAPGRFRPRRPGSRGDRQHQCRTGRRADRDVDAGWRPIAGIARFAGRGSGARILPRLPAHASSGLGRQRSRPVRIPGGRRKASRTSARGKRRATPRTGCRLARGARLLDPRRDGQPNRTVRRPGPGIRRLRARQRTQ